MKSAEVLVKFKGDTKDLDNNTKKASSSLKGFASGLGTAFKVATGVIVGTTTAVATLVKKSVDAYSEFEQLEGGLVSLFGEGSKEMNKILEQSEGAWKNLTLSQNDYLTSFQSAYPLVNAGLGENKDSIEYTNKMLQLSSDLFNTYGGSMENYQNAINWALKGSFVYLDNLNLGIKGTQEGFIEAANASGVLGRNIQSVSELTSDEIIDVIQHYAEEYGVWGKTSQEASTTILGSMNMVKATWSNFITGLSKKGEDVDKLIDNLIDSVLTFAGNVMPVVMRALTSLGNALPKIAKVIAKELPKLVNDLLPPLIEAINILINSLLQALPGLLNTIIPLLTQTLLSLIQSLAQNLPAIIQALLSGIITVIQALAQALPTLIPQLVTAILDALLTILDNIDLLIDAGIQLTMGLLDGILNSLPIIIDKLPEIIDKLVTALIKNLPKLIVCGVQFHLQLWMGIIKALPQLLSKVPQIITNLVNTLKNNLGSVVGVGSNLVKGLWNGISNVTGWIIGKIRGFGSSVMKAIKGIFGVHSPSTEFEWVGRMNMLGFEKGMEGMKSEVQGTIDSIFDLQPNINGQMSSTYSPQMNIQVVNNLETDPLGQLVNKVKTFSGGAKNDYNWGASL